MNTLTICLVALQIVLSLILILVVLLQHGSQTGLSGSIAGGAETFFGKNKGRTIDAKLKKWTSVVAILFLISSIAITFAVKQSAPISEMSMDDFSMDDFQMATGDDSFEVEDVTEQVEGLATEEEEGEAVESSEASDDIEATATPEAAE